MNNIALFICGLVITLISGMGVLIYMTSMGYQVEKKKYPIKNDVDLELRQIDLKKVQSSMDSFVQIPSVS